MTECTTTPLSFTTLGRHRLEADFAGGDLTSDAGALLLREADRRLGLLDALDHALPDPRHPDLITHPQRALLAQRIFGIALGYEDLNDHTTLRHDPLWQVLAEYAPEEPQPLASASTLCRLENRARRRGLGAMAEVLIEQFIASFTEPPECLVLDFDATDDPVHGHQEGRFFHGYYDNYCFLPAMKKTSSSRRRFQGDLMPQRFQALDELARQALRLQAVEVIRPQLGVRHALPQHLVDHYQQRVAHGHQGPLGPTALDQSPVVGRQVRTFRATGRPGRLHQHLPQPPVAVRGAAAAPL